MYECRLCYKEISLLNRTRGYEFCSAFHAVVFLSRVRAGMSGSLPIDVEHIEGPAVLDASAVFDASRPSPAPPPNTDEAKDLLRAIALKQLFFQEPEWSRRRTAVLAGAIVSALALMVFVTPFRKSVMPLSPVAADAAKAAMQERGASSLDMVIQVGSAVPPVRDTVSDQAALKNADKGRDEAPVSEAKSRGAVPVEAVITASSEADLAARPLPSPVPKSEPTPQPSIKRSRVHDASIKTTTAPSWISACVDGRVLAGRLLPLGSELEIEFARQAQVVVGNPGGVQVQLGGRPLGLIGPEGKTRLVELSPSGFRVMATGPAGECGKE
jgi:hypothetical protein